MKLCSAACCLQVWEERDREFVAAGDLTMDEDCLILLIDADTKVGCAGRAAYDHKS